MTIFRWTQFGICVLASVGTAAVAARAEDVNDFYPTAARAEYVFGCMKANGETRQAIDSAPARSMSSRRFAL